FPTDWEEADRIQEFHFMLKHILGGNYSAQLSNIIKPGSQILDIGCGPGHWCFEIAQEFPDADIYGIDITPSFPSKIKPKNCYFQKCDILEGLPFGDNRFDYVFMRYMLPVMKKDQWPAVLKDIKRVMKPGGIIESVELNATPYSMGPIYMKFNEKVAETMLKSFGMDLHMKFEPLFKEMEFQNVMCTNKYISIG
ncbi:3260_t:CDS:2, partial [Cetraspora pellucida]